MGALEAYIDELKLKQEEEQARAHAELSALVDHQKREESNIRVNQLLGGYNLSASELQGLSANERKQVREEFAQEGPAIAMERSRSRLMDQASALRQGAAESTQASLARIRQVASLRNSKFSDLEDLVPRDDALRSEVVIDPKTGAQSIRPKSGLSEEDTRAQEYAEYLGIPLAVVKQKRDEDTLDELIRAERVENLKGGEVRRAAADASARLSNIKARNYLDDRELKKENAGITDRKAVLELSSKLSPAMIEEITNDPTADPKSKEAARLAAIDQADTKKAAELSRFSQTLSVAEKMTPTMQAEIDTDPSASVEMREASRRAKQLDAAESQASAVKNINEWTTYFTKQNLSDLRKKIDEGYMDDLEPGSPIPPKLASQATQEGQLMAATVARRMHDPRRQAEKINGIGGLTERAVKGAEQAVQSTLAPRQAAPPAQYDFPLKGADSGETDLDTTTLEGMLQAAQRSEFPTPRAGGRGNPFPQKKKRPPAAGIAKSLEDILAELERKPASSGRGNPFQR